jgi:hypothetical protein
MKMFVVLNKEKPDTENTRRLKLGGGQAYDRSRDQSAVVA